MPPCPMPDHWLMPACVCASPCLLAQAFGPLYLVKAVQGLAALRYRCVPLPACLPAVCHQAGQGGGDGLCGLPCRTCGHGCGAGPSSAAACKHPHHQTVLALWLLLLLLHASARPPCSTPDALRSTSAAPGGQASPGLVRGVLRCAALGAEAAGQPRAVRSHAGTGHAKGGARGRGLGTGGARTGMS